MITSSLLESILQSDNLSVRFQPIVRLLEDGPVLYGFEGLTRGPENTNMEYPSVLFEYARRKNCESLLDVACVHRIITEARALPSNAYISVNVHASTLSRSDDFVQVLSRISERCDIAPSRIIVEVIEHGAPWSTSAFHRELAELREIGIRIALDDVGVGASNIQMLVDCRPDLLKVDRYFVDGCAKDKYRQAVIGALVHLARGCGAEVLCEGVEEREDLDMVYSLGVDLIQGFYFSRPIRVDEAAGTLVMDQWSSPRAKTTPCGLHVCTELDRTETRVAPPT
jgi:EAL domain-containing protein (putative c-di-GMP-specific phosphodiesterase class I)